MHQRRKAREVALQVLYELDVQMIGLGEAIELFWANFEASEEARKFSSLLIEGAWNNREQIDSLISDSSENWTIARMSRVDKSILRMAVYELLFCRDIPPKVTLNEAIDLGKVYGSENSGAFINGILDALYGRLRNKDENQDNHSLTGCPEP
ncbi:MAG: transcription antitermination factor NusB [Deltaproteobacteria bacterium RBG_16_58_17]|nr:MAG: transcription antitermination factor NusB [Deltaproteobacteria bacterium RBG_16_58_17]OHE17734.1 MAG: transcription antitermination factor NusB [Syntrophobacterales bacterium GWC2_56_13]OHE20671.1 MAG: transcription antitermination factor NusB [Syntrophobacterales bacterium GWF2_56_9]